jgi:hypothetical protein
VWDTSHSSKPKNSSSLLEKRMLLLSVLGIVLVLGVLVVVASLLLNPSGPTGSGSTANIPSDGLQAARETDDLIVFEGSGEKDTQVLDIANKEWVVVTESQSSEEAPYAWVHKEDGEPIFTPPSLDGDDSMDHFAMETAPGRYFLRIAPSSETSKWTVTVYKDAASAPEPSSPVEEPPPPPEMSMPEMSMPAPPKPPKPPKMN